MKHPEVNPLSRRELLKLGATGLGTAGAGILGATLLERYVINPPEQPQRMVSETVANVGLPVVNLLLRGGIVKNSETTKTYKGELPPDLPVQTFTSDIYVTKPAAGIQVQDFHINTRYSITFALPINEYQKIMANPYLTDEQKNENISNGLNFLLAIKSIDSNNGSTAVLFNRMMEDQNGNWTNANTHHTYSETTDGDLIRHAGANYRPFDKRSLQTFADDVEKVSAFF
jgi:hypothetical protein